MSNQMVCNEARERTTLKGKMVMKNSTIAGIFAILSLAFNLTAQTASLNPVSVGVDASQWSVSVAGNTQTWTDTNGHRIVQMATGMNYWSGQQWVPSNPSFQVSQDGMSAVANQVQHKVRLAANLNTNGAVNVITPDGITLNSTPVGIALYDAASGNFATIAWITNCCGFLVSSNTIVYSNAFAGLCADVIYTLQQGSFEQDVVINGHIDPANHGFPSNTTRIEVLTEFYQPPQPDVIMSPILIETNQTLRASMATPDFMDQTLGFGEFVMAAGRAYTAASGGPDGGAPVGKQFVTITNQAGVVRTFLIESVQYSSIKDELNLLSDCDGQLAATGGKPDIQKVRFQYAALPSPHPLASAAGTFKSSAIKVASITTEKSPGVVIDYIATIGSTLSSATVFQSDTTYVLTNNVTCNGAVTIEGGAVFKYPTNSVTLQLNTSLTLQSANYRPAVFTADDDNSVGNAVNTSIWSSYTGTILTNGYGNPALKFNYAFNGTLNNLRFSYSKTAIQFLKPSSTTTVSINHSQFVNCLLGMNISGSGTGSGYTVNVNNCLMANVNSLIGGPLSGFNFRFLYSTMDNSPLLVGSGVAVFTATNCIFADSSTSSNVFSGGNNGFYNYTASFGSSYSATGYPFQSVGAGNYYLASGTGLSGVGTTNIDATLLSQLQQKTTHPPNVSTTGTVLFNLTLYPQAQRDIGTPDLGYHYDPIDYAFGGVALSNATISMTPGVVVAGFDPNSSGYALTIGPGGQFISQGTPVSLDRVINFNAAQEQSTNWSSPATGLMLANGSASGTPSVINCQFTDFSILANDTAHVYAASNGNTAPLNFAECQFHGGGITSFGPTVNLTNCLLERVTSQLWSYDGNTPFLGNNLFWRGTNNLGLGSTSAVVQNNMFDETLINDHGSNSYTGGYNGYITNFNHLTLVSHDQVLTASTNQVGALGNYYIPTNSMLTNAGSTTADALGLYHYTTTTNQVIDGFTQVDIGYHYVAVDGNGKPLDADGDGIPDYLEDANGNGVVDGTETSPTVYNSPNNLASAPGLVVLTPLK